MSTDIEITVIQTTQKVLGKYIKKPPLTEKLLRKPPFRFLHDIITTVIRETGFMKGLYSERELVSDNVKEKEDKIAFLNKLIEAVKSITGTKLSVRAAKVIAGLEPQETNLLLQAVATALDKKLDSSAYISELKSNKKPHADEKPQVHDKKSDRTKSKISTEAGKTKQSLQNVKNEQSKKQAAPIKRKIKEKSSSRDSKDSTPKIKNKSSKIQKTEKLVTPQEVVVETTTSNIIIDENVDELKITENNASNNDLRDSESKIGTSNDTNDNAIDTNAQIDVIRTARPRTATIKKNKESIVVAPSVPPDVTEKPFVRPRSSLRPPTVRPSSARPGAPRLRTDSTIPDGEVVPLGKVKVIVENYDSKDADEEETVTIETTPELEYQQPIIELPTDKGHLVDQILKQITTDEFVEHAKPVVNIEWEQDGLRSRNAASKEIEQLRSGIQTLTRTANPLGKLMNYLHEDIEAMHSELDTWVNSTHQIMSEITSQKLLSIESNKPLQKELEEMDDDIVKLQQQIVSVNGNIIRNEQRIRDLLLGKV